MPRAALEMPHVGNFGRWAERENCQTQHRSPLWGGL